MFNWKAVIIGFILAVIFTFILNGIIGTVGSYFGVLIASITIGYIVNNDFINGAIHGSLIGVMGGIIAILILIIVGAWPYLSGTFGIYVIASIFIDILVGAIGGAIGSILIKK